MRNNSRDKDKFFFGGKFFENRKGVNNTTLNPFCLKDLKTLRKKFLHLLRDFGFDIFPNLVEICRETKVPDEEFYPWVKFPRLHDQFHTHDKVPDRKFEFPDVFIPLHLQIMELVGVLKEQFTKALFDALMHFLRRETRALRHHIELVELGHLSSF